MTDRVNTESNRMQAAHRKPMIDGVWPNPTLQQLPPRNHPMLPSCQIRDELIGLPVRPSQPAYFTV